MPNKNIRQVIATFEKAVRKFIREHPEIVSISITLPSRGASKRHKKLKTKY